MAPGETHDGCLERELREWGGHFPAQVLNAWVKRNKASSIDEALAYVCGSEFAAAVKAAFDLMVAERAASEEGGE